ncbi:cytochrome P450 [Umbelopsis sp. PMI_123]|nr:cytochrome P450 [Umbelopsis sp. PMI_123]
MTLLYVLVRDADQTLANISSFYAEHILPYINRSSPRTFIAAAVATFFSYTVYKMTHIPKNLRHIPSVPYWQYMRSLLSGEGIDVRARKFVLPMLAKSPNGLYLRPKQMGWAVAVANPGAIKTLFLRKDDFQRTNLVALRREALAAKFAGPENIVTLNGDVWKKHRMIANPAFHRSMPVKLFGTLCEKMMVRFEEEGDGLDSVDIPTLMQRFTLDVIGLAAFGYDFEALDNPDNEKVKTYNDISKGTRDPLYFFFPFLEKHFLWALPKRRELHRKMDDVNDVFYSIVEHKRQVLASAKDKIEDAEKDLLTLMLEANEEERDDKHRLSNSEIRDDLAVLFLAGHDTTSNALSFALYHLAANPHVQEKARKEVLDILGDDDIVYPTAAQCSEMKYIYMIMKETLRINPPIQNSSLRKVKEDTELEGTFIPKGSTLSADIYITQHNPSNWKNPETFNPDRFEAGGESESNATMGLAWVAFGSGARQCIGMNFSLAEQKVALAMILRKYT